MEHEFSSLRAYRNDVRAMIPILGHLSLIGAFFAALAVLLMALLRYSPFRTLDHEWVVSATVLQWLGISISFASLIYAHVTSDFAIANVFEHSHKAKPLFYKITGTWGNHEGSMLLWVWILSTYSVVFLSFCRQERGYLIDCLTIQSMLTAAFTGFILLSSNPFERIFPVPLTGKGLNPLLQDIGLAIHPPTLYAGYVGFSIVFSAACSALWRRVNLNQWVRHIHPWILIPWCWLTGGIGLGSWWAYRELGWGGFWFWDPVENASLMPWLLATALVHMLPVNRARNGYYRWTMLLAILTFSSCLLGTFLVRSGVLTSVHSFANDPERGLYILILLTMITGSGFWIFALRAWELKPMPLLTLFSREAMMLFNNVFLVAACATIFLGTLYPLFYEVVHGRSLTVGTPYFTRTFIPIGLMALALAALAPQVRWLSERFNHLRRFFVIQIIIAGFSMVISWILLPEITPIERGTILVLGGLFVSISVSGWRGWQRKRHSHRFNEVKLIGMLLAHTGIGGLALGILLIAVGGKQTEKVMRVGESLEFANHVVEFVSVTYHEGPNFYVRRAQFYVTKPNDPQQTLMAETRLYPVEGSQTTEVAIYSALQGDFYVAMGELSADQTELQVRFYYKPFMWIIWLSIGFMILGGGISSMSSRKPSLQSLQ